MTWQQVRRLCRAISRQFVAPLCDHEEQKKPEGTQPLDVIVPELCSIGLSLELEKSAQRLEEPGREGYRSKTAKSLSFLNGLIDGFRTLQ